MEESGTPNHQSDENVQLSPMPGPKPGNDKTCRSRSVSRKRKLS